MPVVSIMTSMLLRDDVITGESYYIREAKRIRQMVDPNGYNRPSLIVIDEILKGTNTLERLTASFAILEYFTRIPHFESRVTDEDIVFEYHIYKGKGGNSNAIALLSLLKYAGSYNNGKRKGGIDNYEDK